MMGENLMARCKDVPELGWKPLLAGWSFWCPCECGWNNNDKSQPIASKHYDIKEI